MRHRARAAPNVPARWGAPPSPVRAGLPSSALRRLVVQTKMTVGAVADPAEREAERIADQIVSSLARPAGTAPEAAQADDSAARRTPIAVQRVTPEEEELMASRAPVSTAAGPDGGPLDDSTAAAISGARGAGDPLSDGIRRSMEPALGADLSNVRVHTDSRAHELNGALQSRAFTVGSDIFFRHGDYQPDSTAGAKLLAHELTHVVQQGGTRPR